MPKGGASSLTPVYAGVQEDLDTFLKAFLTVKSVRFSDYKQLFRNRQMTQLFNGRSNSAEIIEFNEYLLVSCLPYMEEFVCPGTVRTLEERIFGLYSLYTFFYLQAVDHVVKIRMDPDASRNFHKLINLLLEEKIYDAAMCCQKILKDKAIKLIAFIPVYDPSCFKRFYTDTSVTGVSIQTNVNDPLSNVKALIESPGFRAISVAHEEYSRLKAAGNFDPIPGFTNRDPLEEARVKVENRLKHIEIRSGVYALINSDHTTEQLESHGMARAEIKEKAYESGLKLTRFRRHRSCTPLQISTESFNFSKNVDEEGGASIENKEDPINGQISDSPEKPEKKIKKRGRKPKEDNNPRKSVPMTHSRRKNGNDVGKRGRSSPEVVEKDENALEVIVDEQEAGTMRNCDSIDVHLEPVEKRLKRDASPTEIRPESTIIDSSAPTSFELDGSFDDEIMPPGVTLKTQLDEKMKRRENAQNNESKELQSCSESRKIVKVKTEIQSEFYSTLTQTSIKVKLEELSIDEIPDLHEISMLKPIIKTNEKKMKPKRHVSFAENMDGELDTTIHEIPSRSMKKELDDEEREVIDIGLNSGVTRKVSIKKEQEIEEIEEPLDYCSYPKINKETIKKEPKSEQQDDTESYMFMPLENEQELLEAKQNDSDDDDLIIVDEEAILE